MFLDDTQFLAALGIAVNADGFSRCKAGVEHLSLDVFTGHNRRHEEFGRRVVELRLGLWRLAAQELDGDPGSFRGHDFARLVDRVVLVPSNDQLEGSDGGVIAGHGRKGIHASSLESRDGAAAGAVIRSDNADDLVTETGDLAARPLLRLVRYPVGGVKLREQLIAAV